MSDDFDPGDPTSRKGWVGLGYDRRIWIPCPPAFPDGMDRQAWAAGFAEEWWAGSGRRHSPVDVLVLARQLAALHEGSYGHIPCHLMFVHLPDPRLDPLPIFLGIFQSFGDREASLRLLTHADDPDAVEPPIVDEFSTAKLGAGIRVLRHLRTDDGALYAALNYAWRSDEYETDLRLWATSDDLGRLERARPDIDEFARTLSFRPREGLMEV